MFDSFVSVSLFIFFYIMFHIQISIQEFIVIFNFLPLELIGLTAKALNEYLDYESNRLFTDLMMNRSIEEESLKMAAIKWKLDNMK